MQLDHLIRSLKEKQSIDDKILLLSELGNVRSYMLLPHYQKLYASLSSKEYKLLFLSIVAIDEGASFFDPAHKTKDLEALEQLFAQWLLVDQFYRQIGGLLGYIDKVRKLLKGAIKQSPQTLYPPKSESIEENRSSLRRICNLGISYLDKVAFIIPAGGLGMRLHLMDEHAHPLPVAYLPFAGRSLLEGVVRDIEGLEHLFYNTYGRSITIPIALMISKEQNNESNMRTLLDSHNYFGRPRDSLRLFSQLSVPVMTIEGHLSAEGPAEFLFHPSGHGVLWKCAEDAGIFNWFKEKGIEHLLLRQINNPIAALDYNLPAFLALCVEQNKSFGFLACDRIPAASEGVLVDVEENGNHFITNIEYTETRHKILEHGLANTNILYAHIDRVREKLAEKSLFGLIVNMKSDVPKYLPTGSIEKIKGGRLESMMQNISEQFVTKKTLIVKNQRDKVMAAIKRSYVENETPLETPQGAYYIYLRNNYELLSRCTKEPLPAFCSIEEFLDKGPSLLFSYHPSLGPFYELIEKKVGIKRVGAGSELELEIDDFVSKELILEGALSIVGVGGKCIFENVTVQNRGIDRQKSHSYWNHDIAYLEKCRITIQKGGELLVKDVTFTGSHNIEIEADYRLTITQDERGTLLLEKVLLKEPFDTKEDSRGR